MLYTATFLLVSTTPAEQLLATWPINFYRSNYWRSDHVPNNEGLPASLNFGYDPREWSLSLRDSDIGETFYANLDDFNTHILTDGTNSTIDIYAENEGAATGTADPEASRFGLSPYSLNGIDFEGYTITAISFTLEDFESRVVSELIFEGDEYDPPDYVWSRVIAVTGTYSFYGQPNLNIHTAVELEWPSVSGLVYQVQWNTNLSTNVWHDLGDTIIGDGTTNHVFDSTKHAPKKFYRIDIQ